MDHDCGWVEILRADSDTVLGRGRLVVTLATDASPGRGATNRGQFVPRDERWRGRLESVRVADGVTIAAGSFRIRFEANPQVLQVRLESWEPGDDGSGTAHVQSIDGALPVVLAEIGGR